MRVLLDECVPRKLRTELATHDVSTVQEMGWAGIKNGALLDAARKTFDSIVTVDQRFAEARDVSGLVVIVLRAGTLDVNVLRQLMPQARDLIDSAQPGTVHVLRLVGA